MIALATGAPTVKVDGDQILVAFPSGRDDVTVSLSLNQLIHLLQDTSAAVNAAFAAPKPRTAEVIKLRRKK